MGLTLDTGHLILGGGAPLEGVRRWGDRINHVHLKDARRNADGWQLSLLGEGEIPVKEALRLLNDAFDSRDVT